VYLDSAGEVQSDDSHGYGTRHCRFVVEFLRLPCSYDTSGVRTECSWVWLRKCEDLLCRCGIATSLGAQFVDLKVNHDLLARRSAGMAESVCCRNRRHHASSNTSANPSVPSNYHSALAGLEDKPREADMKPQAVVWFDHAQPVNFEGTVGYSQVVVLAVFRAYGELPYLLFVAGNDIEILVLTGTGLEQL
jgi:hypothetical protein